MKKIKLQAVILFLICLVSQNIHGQQSAGEYMNKINVAQGNISQDFFNYMSAVFHGKSARKVEKKRKELLTDLYKAKGVVGKMEPYNDADTSLRAATYSYLSILIDILNNDFSKIVNMEEISEQSYDNMEAYMLAQEKADEKLKDAANANEAAYKAFAVKNNVNLVENDSKIEKKLAVIGNVNNYYHSLYLIFFKSFKQEAYLTNAVNDKNISAIEQNRTALASNAEEGLNKLGSITSYEDDMSVVNAGKKLLEFYKSEANDKIPSVTGFLVQTENMEKMKKAMDGKSNKSQEDVDNYNKAINDYNSSVKAYNKTNNELNSNRSKTLNDWNNAVDRFLDKHTPR